MLDDSFALAAAMQLDYRVPLNLSKYLVNEDEYAPWRVASKKFKSLMEVLIYKPLVFENLLVYIRFLISKAYKLVSRWQIGDDISKK